MHKNLLHYFLAPQRVEKTALIEGAGAISYDMLRQMVINAQALITQQGVQPGEVVALICDDSADSVAMFLACLGMQVIPTMINPGGADEVILDMLEKSHANLILTDQNKLHRMRGLVKFHVLDLKAPYVDHAELMICDLKPLDPAFYLFTSGTTGYPHCVCHRHQDVVVMCDDYGTDILSLSEKDILMATSKMFFAYGLNSILFALYFGATCVLSRPKLEVTGVWKRLMEHHVSVFFAVPTVFNMLLKAADNIPPGLPLRLAVSAGERLPTTIAKKWFDLFQQEIIDGIGTTEILSTFISNKPGEVQRGTTGQVVKGFEIKLLNEDLSVALPGEIATLWVKGDTYHHHYIDDSFGSAQRFVDGWFNTMDLFSKDEDDFLTYHGRANDIIKCGGLWVSPYKMEQVLMQHPAVEDAAVKGVEQENGLMRPAAFVVLHEPISDELVKTLKQYVKSHCQAGEYPHFIYQVTQLPRTASGKVQRYRLKEITQKKETADAC